MEGHLARGRIETDRSDRTAFFGMCSLGYVVGLAVIGSKAAIARDLFRAEAA
jgi:hypothetical protein